MCGCEAGRPVGTDSWKRCQSGTVNLTAERAGWSPTWFLQGTQMRRPQSDTCRRGVASPLGGGGENVLRPPPRGGGQGRSRPALHRALLGVQHPYWGPLIACFSLCLSDTSLSYGRTGVTYRPATGPDLLWSQQSKYVESMGYDRVCLFLNKGRPLSHPPLQNACLTPQRPCSSPFEAWLRWHLPREAPKPRPARGRGKGGSRTHSSGTLWCHGAICPCPPAPAPRP